MTQRLRLITHQLKIIKYLLSADLSKQAVKQGFDCPVCGAYNIEMLPIPAYFLGKWQQHQTVHNPFFLETMNLEHYLCSKCFSPDRDRLYALYLNEYFANHTGKLQLLDIAPSLPLQNFIKSKPNVQYRSMDLMMQGVDDNLDITDMHAYANERFDFFICSHVLEHIPNDIKAMQELYRITKKGGNGIIMVPINLQLEETTEDPNSTDINYKWKYFFQDDHVRMYAKKDFIARLNSAGFKISQLSNLQFTKEIFAKHAIYPTSVLYVVSKD